MPGRGIAGLPARDIEADHTAIAVLHHEVGDLAALGRSAHRREQGADADTRRTLPLAEAIEHGIDHVPQGQTPLGVQLGSEAHLGVDDAGRSKVAIIIAPNFAADLRGGRGAQAQVLIDGSDPNIAQTALFAAQSVGQARSARTAGRAPTTLDLRPTVLYNPSLDATRNFVPGLIGLILQLVTVILTSSTIVRERERGTFEQLIVTPVSRWELLLGKLTPYLVVSFWNTGVILVLGYLIFGVEVIGSISLLMFLSAIFLTGSLGLGLLISAVSSTSAQAIQASVFTTLPAFILSGFIFPTDSMPFLMRALGYLLPLTYFLRIIRGIAMKGIGFMQLLDAIVPLTLLSVGIFVLSLTRFRKTLE